MESTPDAEIIRLMVSQFRIPFFRQVCLTGLSSLLSVGLVFLRVHISGSVSYFFLIWNLFLAVIPVLLSLLLFRLYASPNRCLGPLFFLGSFLWLLFFPNAPYIFTDFLHLKPRPHIPLWFDTVLLFSFAWNGITSGFLSLRVMHLLIERRANGMAGWLFVLVVCPLAAFGIFLGRFLRWNSWDVLHNPLPLLNDLLELLRQPVAWNEQTSIVLFVSPFLFLAYASVLGLGSMRAGPGGGVGAPLS